MRRRHFIAAMSAGIGAGLSATAFSGLVRAATAPASRSFVWDLIVIGGGTAGMPAAIFAARAGAKVLVLERAPVIGGTLDRSTGQMAASRTVFQQALGIEDSPDAHYADNMRINGGTADPAITRRFVDEAPATLNWLASAGFTVREGHPVEGLGHDPFLVRRYQMGPEGGISILKAMRPLFAAEAARGGIQLRLETGAVDLLQDASGTVVGVASEDASGARARHRGRAVLIASGGCAANPRMFEDLHGVPLTTQIAYPYSQGDGLLLAMGAGGYLRGGDKYMPLFGTLLESEQIPSAQEAPFVSALERRQPWEIWVNAGGERFVREDHPGHEHRQQALRRQSGHRLWVIADQRTLERAPPFIAGWDAARIRAAIAARHPMIVQDADLRVLALKAGIDPKGLPLAVERYNAALTRGAPDELGRQFRPVTLDSPPYVAVRMTGWTVVSFAGIAVDGDLRVLRPDGRPIPGLYAAGEVIGAGATSGSAYTNGSLVTPALAFGRWLGQRVFTLSPGGGRGGLRTSQL